MVFLDRAKVMLFLTGVPSLVLLLYLNGDQPVNVNTGVEWNTRAESFEILIYLAFSLLPRQRDTARQQHQHQKAHRSTCAVCRSSDHSRSSPRRT
jgi:hypothetical protein